MVAPLVAAAGITAAASGVGKIADAVLGKKSSDEAWDRQKKVLKNQIQWKVADATKAGLHPLAALGVNPASGPAAAPSTDFGSMGQDLGRAVEALMTPEDKAAGALAKLQLERGGLENELLKSQIASQRMRNIQQGTPGVPNSSASPAASLPIPGTDQRLNVTHPGLGQAAEDNYSDIGGAVFGGSALAVDVLKYYGLEKALTGPTLGQVAGDAGAFMNKWMQAQLARLRKPPRSTHGYDYNYGSGRR